MLTSDAPFLIRSINRMADERQFLAGDVDPELVVVSKKVAQAKEFAPDEQVYVLTLEDGVVLPDQCIHRLDLSNVQYGIMEHVLKAGVDALKARAETLTKLAQEIQTGTKSAPEHFNLNDVERAAHNARDEAHRAAQILDKVEWRPGR